MDYERMLWSTHGLAIACLSSSSAVGAEATLEWTAPGNDGTIGQASTYDIRYSIAPITDANWAQATPLVNLPAPKPSGSREVFKVLGLLPATTYYFALKTADSRPNWSVLSNTAVNTTCLVGCVGVRGDIDQSGTLPSLADFSKLMSYLMGTGYAPSCMIQANVDGLPSSDSPPSLSDLSKLLSYLRGSGWMLLPCP